MSSIISPPLLVKIDLNMLEFLPPKDRSTSFKIIKDKKNNKKKKETKFIHVLLMPWKHNDVELCHGFGASILKKH